MWAFSPTSLKLIGASIGAALLIMLGWYANGVRWENKYQARELELSQAYDKKRDELMAKWEAQREADQVARSDLIQSLESVRDFSATLQTELRRTRLTPTTPRVERMECSDEGTPVAIANPFSGDFVRLWNDSAAGQRPTSTNPGEAAGGDATVR